MNAAGEDTTKRPALSRRRPWAVLCAALIGTGILVASAGARAGGTDPVPNPPAPGASLLPGHEQVASSAGDVAAADRLLRAGGWRPEAHSLRLVGTRQTPGGNYSLFSYRAGGQLMLLAVGESDPLGGVHGSCRAEDEPTSLCGTAIQLSRNGGGHALAVGTAAGAQRVGIRSSDGSMYDAVLSDGLWFARVPIDSTSISLHRSIVTWGHDGSFTHTPAADLDAHIASTSTLVARGPGERHES